MARIGLETGSLEALMAKLRTMETVPTFKGLRFSFQHDHEDDLRQIVNDDRMVCIGRWKFNYNSMHFEDALLYYDPIVNRLQLFNESDDSNPRTIMFDAANFASLEEMQAQMVVQAILNAFKHRSNGGCFKGIEPRRRTTSIQYEAKGVLIQAERRVDEFSAFTIWIGNRLFPRQYDIRVLISDCARYLKSDQCNGITISDKLDLELWRAIVKASDSRFDTLQYFRWVGKMPTETIDLAELYRRFQTYSSEDVLTYV